MRGCSVVENLTQLPAGVFPAYAGMFRKRRLGGLYPHGFPRVCGDVPATSTSMAIAVRFSPHTRGCSGTSGATRRGSSVFPAYAGMFRLVVSSLSLTRRFPRIRGDVPAMVNDASSPFTFSPHTRGCSGCGAAFIQPVVVFPAYPGMFQPVLRTLPTPNGFPRIRGDVPTANPAAEGAIRFSPHTRGYSGCCARPPQKEVVFPAYAGMFPKSQPPCLPKPFSPHTRGCSRGKACNEEDSSEII